MSLKEGILAIVFMVWVVLVCPLWAMEAAYGRPNVIVVMVDDLGWSDLGCYGGEIETPNLDRLAEKGLRMTQFYNTAKCEPSRATLLSGCYHREVDFGKLNNCMTLAEVMKRAGYTTLMSGKWHLKGNPVERGFDRYFGHLSGATNFFKGDDTFRIDDKPFKVPEEGFYTTDADTDYAIRFMKEAKAKNRDKPFFLYLAYNAPHYPLQAKREDVEKYLGRYMKGWDAVRQTRYERQLQMGIIKPEWQLAKNEGIKSWDALTEKEKDYEDMTMATFAAMVDSVDQNIGRLMDELEKMGETDTTLFMFFSDNGGCPFQRTKTPDLPTWSPDSFITYHEAWAQVSNTPFRLYKQNQHEGGISSPFIAWWPGKIEPDRVDHQAGHLVDIMATMLDLTGQEYPATFKGQPLRPLRGKSLIPIFLGKKREGHEDLYFEFNRYKALRVGKWKISWQYGPWELYDIEADRTEMHNLAKQMPEKVESMAKRYSHWRKNLEAGRKQRKR